MTPRQRRIYRCLTHTADALLLLVVAYAVWLMFGATAT